jgi:hypothetical protein
VIALSGAIWQLLRAPAPSPEVVGLRAEIAELKRQTGQQPAAGNVPAVNSSLSSPVPRLPRRYYSKEEKEELASAMHRTGQVLTQDGLPAAQEALAIANGVSDVPSPDGIRSLIQRIIGIVTRLDKVEQVIWHDIFLKKSDPIYDLQLIIESNHNEVNGTINALRTQLNTYLDGLQTLQRVTDAELLAHVTVQVRGANAIQLRTIRGNFISWAQQSLANINNMQRELANETGR